ncbi:unannotated protein [freshwater metagenome]|uniref:Unannotated protein n=1 Tax=freshwater metagenome TaxID=449393 RepID=A0A6J7VSL6_9ZZZZ
MRDIWQEMLEDSHLQRRTFRRIYLATLFFRQIFQSVLTIASMKKAL